MKQNNDPLEMKRPFLSPRFIPLITLLLIAILLSLFLPDFFRQVILSPVLSRVALLYGLYRAFPQNVMWGFLVFVVFVVALGVLLSSRPPVEESFEEGKDESRLRKLTHLTNQAQSGQHARWELAREIQQLTLGLMQLETTDTPEILRERIRKGLLPAPPEIVNLLDLCASLPSYRSFLEAREAAPNQRISQLDQFDPQRTIDALARWRQSSQELV